MDCAAVPGPGARVSPPRRGSRMFARRNRWGVWSPHQCGENVVRPGCEGDSAADLPMPPPPPVVAPVGKGKAPIIGKGRAKAQS
jgi:hypothetical protein